MIFLKRFRKYLRMAGAIQVYKGSDMWKDDFIVIRWFWKEPYPNIVGHDWDDRQITTTLERWARFP